MKLGEFLLVLIHLYRKGLKTTRATQQSINCSLLNNIAQLLFYLLTEILFVAFIKQNKNKNPHAQFIVGKLQDGQTDCS